MGGLTVLFTTIGGLTFIGSGIALLVILLQRGSLRAAIVTAIAGLIVVAVCAICAYVFASHYYENSFYSLYSDFSTSRSAVGIIDEKANEVRPKLLKLIDELVGLDSQLTEAVESRPEQLKTLVERYPELRANEKVRELMANYTKLTADIADQKLVADSFANAYNKNTRTWPARYFAPDDLPPQLPLYYPTYD